MRQLALLKGILIVSIIGIFIYPIYVLFFIYPSFHNIIIIDKEEEAQQIVNYLVKGADLETSVLNKWAEYLTLDQMQYVEEFRNGFDLLKVRVFSGKGLIVYSTNKDEIDKVNKSEQFNTTVMKGKVYSRFVKNEKLLVHGKNLITDVVEISVPIMQNNNFQGAVEVYYNIEPTLAKYRRLFVNSNILLSIIAIALLSGILFTFNKANSNIKVKNEIENALIKKTEDLEYAEKEISALQGIVPICSYCKKVRDDEGFWQQVGDYINKHSEASVSHGVCPDCLKKNFPDMKDLHERLGLD